MERRQRAPRSSLKIVPALEPPPPSVVPYKLPSAPWINSP
jgi:hypothetical protein